MEPISDPFSRSPLAGKWNCQIPLGLYRGLSRGLYRVILGFHMV